MRGKTILYSIVEITSCKCLVAGSHRLVSACLIFNVADVQLGVLFISHRMFSPFLHFLHCDCSVHSYSESKLLFCFEFT